VRLDHKRAPAPRLLAVGEQSHARTRDAEDGTGEGRAHERELHQVLAPRLGVRTDVQQRHRSPGQRQRQRQRRAVDAAHAPDVEQARGQRGAGSAGAHQRLRPARRHRLGGQHDRRLGRAAGGPRGIVALGDRSGRVHHLDLRRQLAQLGCRAEQDYAHTPRRRQRRPGSHLGRTEVGAVAVDRNDRRGMVQRAPEPRGGRSP
jgi:hypothetical protein